MTFLSRLPNTNISHADSAIGHYAGLAVTTEPPDRDSESAGPYKHIAQ